MTEGEGTMWHIFAPQSLAAPRPRSLHTDPGGGGHVPGMKQKSLSSSEAFWLISIILYPTTGYFLCRSSGLPTLLYTFTEQIGDLCKLWSWHYVDCSKVILQLVTSPTVSSQALRSTVDGSGYHSPVVWGNFCKDQSEYNFSSGQSDCEMFSEEQ